MNPTAKTLRFEEKAIQPTMYHPDQEVRARMDLSSKRIRAAAVGLAQSIIDHRKHFDVKMKQEVIDYLNEKIGDTA
jgi:hypothetical protein